MKINLAEECIKNLTLRNPKTKQGLHFIFIIEIWKTHEYKN